MPELPEVETYRRRIAPKVIGGCISGTWVGKTKFRRATNFHAEKFIGKKCLGVDRHGKWLILRFAGGQDLFVHLGMSGRFEVRELKFVPDRHDHLALLLAGGISLVFNDRRRFGAYQMAPPLILGPDALSANFSAEWVNHVAPSSRSTIAAFLLNQQRVAGLGTIYASESLHAAQLNPSRGLNSLSKAEINRLVSSIKNVLRKAIEVGGTTLEDYRGTANELGNYERFLNVYGKLGCSCPRCRRKNKVVSTLISNRRIYSCLHCQI